MTSTSSASPPGGAGDQGAIVQELLDGLWSRGFQPQQECVSTARVALGFIGLGYRMEEELNSDGIDCSTLTSQAHWLGAAVGIPFIAENQRAAPSGRAIRSQQHLLPGDVVVGHRSLAATREGLYNHVGMVVGWDSRSTPWVVESAEGHGVRVSTLRDFGPAGGVRRFLPRPLDRFASRRSRSALRLAHLVPKLGRFGARQYLRASQQRPRHVGVDLYCPASTPVVAPMTGRVEIASLDREATELVRIVNDDTGALCELAQMHRCPGVSDGVVVTRGELLGHVTTPAEESEIQYVGKGDQAHLHLAYAGPASPGMVSFPLASRRYANPLYACKLGYIQAPLRVGMRERWAS